ncbi:hypothetical protein [Photorhabdus bodei]|uniref:Uncharacterized protein n=1 Tax=Photorhabdus bodei TaxID=2029681 RepID=A0AAW6BQC9_9GAMM|nr:hypothetical protein [Photorhabdus bodei]MCC8466214.1 hypothetical protein [Photorhabdus bodei]MDB6374224.1 hypothetical protein [Photorhabdus bodei]
MTGVSERSQQRGNLKDNGYMAQKSRFIPPFKNAKSVLSFLTSPPQKLIMIINSLPDAGRLLVDM